MSTSTNGQLSYGIIFDEGFEFPWTKDPWDGDERHWWRDVNGFKNSKEIYSNGDYIGGKRPNESVIDAYYNEQHAWEKANPLPIELVNYCSAEYPMYMLAVPETCKSNSRGDATVFNPAELVVTEEQKAKLMEFCQKYLGEIIDEFNNDEYNDQIVLEPNWYLTSYWG